VGAVLNPGLAAQTGEAFTGFIEWAAQREWRDLPSSAQRRAVLILADDLAAALSALDEPEVARAHERLQASALTPATASLLRPGLPRVGTSQAAMGNGLAMGWNELDEGFRKAVCHAGLYTLPALLAVAESEGASLQDVLRALVLGYETATRVARGWRFPAMNIHPHALLAPVGAAAGVAFLRRLPPAQIAGAVACAATLGMAGPFNQATQGVLTRNTWAAQGAVAGLNAIEWSDCGILGDASSLHSVYAVALGAQADLSAWTLDADAAWAVESGYTKINACCQYAHSTIEAVQLLLERHPALRGGQQVEAIEVEVHPLGHALDNRAPDTTLGAKFSVPHAVAAALVHGNGGVRAFDAASLHDPQLARLRQLVRLRPFEGVRAWPEDRPSRVTVTTAGGARLTAACWSARGGPDKPFAEADLWAKFESIAAERAPAFVATMRQLAALEAGGDGLSRPWAQWLQTALN
jgi:2-methylcitrate dehydratase PrpD